MLKRFGLAALLFAGCNTATTSSLPTPSFQAGLGDRFVLRVGDLGLVVGSGQYLYISVQSVGRDTRCPPDNPCDPDGHLEVSFEVENAELQNSLAMAVPSHGAAIRLFQGLEIRMHEVAPAGQANQIPSVDYRFLMSVEVAESE